MFAFRNLSLSTHGAIELAAGLATMLASLALGFGPAGIVVSFLLGAVLVGMSLTLTSRRDQLPGTHHEFDSAFLVTAAVASLGLALGGQGRAGAMIAALVVLQSVLALTTRYTAPRS